jgi:GTPase SAR1 family protein
MLDAGLRVSEAISLTFGAFDFKKQILTVKSLKKRKTSKDFQDRQIPLSQRLFLHLVDYSKEFNKIDRDTYLFPSPTNKGKHICRFAVSNYLKRLSFKKLNIQNLHPHALRHTCATNLVATGTELHKIADILGHQKLDTSRIYTHIPPEQLAKNINAAATRSGAKRNFFSFLYAKPPPIPYIPNQRHTAIIGRSSEMQTVSDHLEKGTNVIIFGDTGTGKRLLLESIKTDKFVLTFDDTASIKTSLIYMLIYLYENNHEQVKKILFGDFDLNKVETRLSRQSVSFLCDEIKRIVLPKQYVLKIKQFDNVTKAALKVLDSLKDTFVILTTATEISITKAPFFWNFEKIELKKLNRLQSFELIHKLSYDIEIEDYEIYRNHIWQQTDGNPKAITEMVERYRREPRLVADSIRNIEFSDAVKEWDFSYILVLLIASLAVMRFMTSELDNPALRFIGGMAMILLLMSRAFVARTKRKMI